MLVLTRKVNQSIMINLPHVGEIEVTVAEIRGDSIRLGVDAPKNVTVHRKEIYLQVRQQNEAASETPASAPTSTVGKALDQVRRGKSLSR